MEVTQKQIDMMKHALGLNYKKRPYRNYFFTNENNPGWNDLVSKGFAVRGTDKFNENDDSVYFWLTKSGAEFAYGKTISQKKYDEL